MDEFRRCPWRVLNLTEFSPHLCSIGNKHDSINCDDMNIKMTKFELSVLLLVFQCVMIIPDIPSTAQGKESDVDLKCDTPQCNSLSYSRNILPKICPINWSLIEQHCLLETRCYTSNT